MSVLNASKFLGNLIFKKSVQKQTGIMKTINPMEKKLAENKAKFALEQLQKNNNIDINNLSANDFEMLAENIVNPIKNVTQTSVKSADILDFRYKRNFAEELADASKKGDFKQMTGIMKVDPKFKEVMESLKASKAADAAKAKMLGSKKLIPDRDVIPYQSPEVQKLDFADKLKRAGLTEREYMDNIVKRGYGVDDAIYARDFYGDTTDQIIKNANTKGAPVAFAGGGVAGLLGERTGYKDGKDVFIGPKRKKKTKKELEDEKILKEKIAAYLESQTINLPEEDPLKKYQPTDYSLYGGFMDNVKMKEDRTGNIINDFNNISIDPTDARVGISRFNPKTNSSFVAGAGPSGFNIGFKKQFADGGPARQNFAMGKRAFLKFMGAGAAGIAGLKTGLFGLGKKAAVKEVAKEVATGGPPPHFLKLVAKIKALGDDATPKYGAQPREKVTSYKDYTLSEELDSGRTTIQRSKQSEVDYYDEMLMEDVYMSHTPGKGMADETTKGKNIPDEYVEDTSYMRTSGPQKGDILDTVDGIPDDILEELGEAVVKKADGGRIGYSKGKIVTEGIPGLLKLVKNKFGKESITTADKIKIPQKTLDRNMFKNFETKFPETSAADTTLNIPVQQEGKFTKAEYLIQRLENTIKESPNDKYVKKTFPGFIKELKANPELAKNENVFKELGGDLPEGQQIVVYGDDTLDFFTQKSGPGNIDRLKKLTTQYPSLSREKALKIMKMEPNDQVMELKMLEIANRTVNSNGGLAAMLGE